VQEGVEQIPEGIGIDRTPAIVSSTGLKRIPGHAIHAETEIRLRRHIQTTRGREMDYGRSVPESVWGRSRGKKRLPEERNGNQRDGHEQAKREESGSAPSGPALGLAHREGFSGGIAGGVAGIGIISVHRMAPIADMRRFVARMVTD
jgi:hypothetical protein